MGKILYRFNHPEIKKIWSGHCFFVDVFCNALVEVLAGIAGEIYDELSSKTDWTVLKVTSKDAFVEALIGDFLINFLHKYKQSHPNFGSGEIQTDEEKLDALGPLNTTIISWKPEPGEAKH